MTMLPTREQPARLAGPPARMDAPAGGAGITPRDVLRIIRRRKLLITLAFAITLAVVVVGTFLWQTLAPLYRATALLRVTPPVASSLQVLTPFVRKDVIENHKRSVAALVKDPRVLDAASRDPEIVKTKWYSGFKKKEDVVIELDDRLSVSVVPETVFIRLSMMGLNKTELPDIVNAVARHFTRLYNEGKLFTAVGTRLDREATIRKFTAERDRLRAELDQVFRDMTAVKRDSPLAAMPEGQSVVALKLRNLTQELSDAQVMEAQARAALAANEQEERSGALARNPEVLNAVEFDVQVRQLQARLADLNTALDNAVRIGGEKHRAVQTLRSQIASTERALEQRTEEVTKSAIERIKEMRRLQVALATQQLASVTERLEEVNSEARDLEDALGRLAELQAKREDIKNSLALIDKRLVDLRLMGESGSATGEEGAGVGPVDIGQTATVPLRPAHPKWEVMLPAGAFLGLLLGFGLAFLLEFADTSIKTPSDLARRVDLPLLGMVPHSDDLEEEVEDFRRVTLLAPHSPAAEAFRQIRTNLLFSGPAQQRRSLLVTSPSPEDGRTTVVMNLATAMAQSGRRVLVVDANFRQPAIAGMFPEAAAAGLSSALVGQAAWRDVVSPTGVPNLSVVTSGPLPPNPAELLGSETMKQVLEEMVAEYDQVILDASPVMLVSDACVLATLVDGVILVVRAGSNSRGIVQRAAEMLARVGARVLGVVLQGVRSTAGGYLRKNYETFYEYHQRPLP